MRVLRRYIEQLPESSSGWLAGLRDPKISRALQLIHGQSARDWTLEDSPARAVCRAPSSPTASLRASARLR